MLSTKHATLAIKILALLLVAAVSFFFLSKWVPETEFANYSMEQVEKNNDTVLALEGATLAASLAISAFPDDFGSSYATALTDLNIFFILILTMLLIEKLLLIFGFKFAFSFAVPAACLAYAIAMLLKKDTLKSFAARLCILGLAIAFAVPGSIYIGDIVATDLDAYVEETIAETNSGANKLNAAMTGENDDQTIFEKASNLFSTAINGITELLEHFKNMVTKYVYAIIIMLIKTIVMPILTFFFLRWILNETFHIMVPAPQVKVIREKLKDEYDEDDEDENKSLLESAKELIAIGE